MPMDIDGEDQLPQQAGGPSGRQGVQEVLQRVRVSVDTRRYTSDLKSMTVVSHRTLMKRASTFVRPVHWRHLPLPFALLNPHRLQERLDPCSRKM